MEKKTDVICSYIRIEFLAVIHGIIIISIYSLSDLGFSSNLIGSLSRSN